jgi:hypothetical protein
MNEEKWMKTSNLRYDMYPMAERADRAANPIGSDEVSFYTQLISCFE